MLKYYYQCNDCGKEIETTAIVYLCEDCKNKNIKNQPTKGVLKTLYHFNLIKKTFEELKQNQFLDILPIKNIENMPKLRIGKTPFYKIENFENEKLEFELYLKDDAQNPTFSFKDRASALVSAFAKEKGIDTIITASTGNAGSSLAGICASQRQKAIIYVPATAPKAKLTQIVMYGAKIITVDGTYDQAFDLCVQATEQYDYYNRNTAYNPFTIEGKKSVSFEMFDDLQQTIPDRIFVPTGDGVIISGVFKGYEDLLKLGYISKMPTIIAVQSENSKNIATNIEAEQFISYPTNTIADSISVDIPRNFYMTKNFIKQYNGETVIVSDEQILEASKLLSQNTGIFAEPAAVASFAGLLKYKNENKLQKNSKNVVLLTGSGLKDLNSVQKLINLPKPIKPLS